jgi:hypothetical protein
MALLGSDVSPIFITGYIPLETIFLEHFQKMLAKLLKSKSKKHQSVDKRVVSDGHSLLDRQCQTSREYTVHFPKILTD